MPALGDHSDILDNIDPFRDGKAGERIGNYIYTFLEKLDSGFEKNKAIEWCNDQYAENWGNDKIIKMN